MNSCVAMLWYYSVQYCILIVGSGIANHRHLHSVYSFIFIDAFQLTVVHVHPVWSVICYQFCQNKVLT
jgi:hypothetical protein